MNYLRTVPNWEGEDSLFCTTDTSALMLSAELRRNPRKGLWMPAGSSSPQVAEYDHRTGRHSS